MGFHQLLWGKGLHSLPHHSCTRLSFLALKAFDRDALMLFVGIFGVLILFGQALAMVSRLCGATWGAPWLAGAFLLPCPLPHTTWLQPNPRLHMGTRSPVSSYLPPGLLQLRNARECRVAGRREDRIRKEHTAGP